MSYEEQAARGARAQREWEELDSAFVRVREAILAELAQTSVSQPDKVLKLHMAVQNLSAVEKAIREVIDNGTIARHALDAAALTRPN